VAKFGLGKGLGALIPEHQQFFEQSTQESPESMVRLVSIESLSPNPDQPRKTFSQESLDELAESIRRHGLLQPLLVQEQEAGKYIIIAGERRYRAAQIAGLDQLPVIVRAPTAATDTSSSRLSKTSSAKIWIRLKRHKPTSSLWRSRAQPRNMLPRSWAKTA